MGRLSDGIRAPSTLGTLLRTRTFGQVRRLDAVAARFLARLAVRAPMLPGGDVPAFVDGDDTVKATYGYAKQGAGSAYRGQGPERAGRDGVQPAAAPLIVGSRLRGARRTASGAARLVAGAAPTAQAAGGGPDASGLVILRTDSAFYRYLVIAAARRPGARSCVTVPAKPSVTRTIDSIDETAWQPIHYPHAVRDDQAKCLVSGAKIAEVPFTAFTGRRHGEQIAGGLLVRRVRRLNTSSKASKTSPTGNGGRQGELFAGHRFHAANRAGQSAAARADTSRHPGLTSASGAAARAGRCSVQRARRGRPGRRARPAVGRP